MVSWRSLLIVGVILLLSIVFLGTNLLDKKIVEVGGAREIMISAKRFAFTPDTISVKKGERIRLRISSEDVPHGFSILELGINEIIEPGKETVVELTPTKEGIFRYFCSIECGTGHFAMQGRLTVE